MAGKLMVKMGARGNILAKSAGDHKQDDCLKSLQDNDRGLVHKKLKELGLAPSKERGQNFLKDYGQIQKIVSAILNETEQGKIMEIGPGLGALTLPLLKAGTDLTVVELDRGLAENLQASLAPSYPQNLKIVHRDILNLTNEDLAPQAPFYLCGNLPYSISSLILFWFLNRRDFFSGATFMLQKEMAQRLTAESGTKDYGRLTVALSLWFQIKKLFLVPPSAFHPRPTVESMVISLSPRPQSQCPDISPQTLGRLTAAAFAARRKTISNNLIKVYGREASEKALAEIGIPGSVRAERISADNLASLAKKLEKN